MEFCKDRVFTSLNADELKPGDKVITANCMADLKVWAQSNENAREILLIHDDTNLARFEVKGSSGSYISALAYLVERAENCGNCGDEECPDAGKDCKFLRCAVWKPKTEDKWCKNCGVEECSRAGVDADVRCPAWQPRAEKKCKDCGNAIDEEGKYCSGDEKHHWVDQTGEQKCWRPKAEPHYRPFRDTDELIKVWNKKFYLDFKPTHDPLTMPLIWVRQKGDATDRGHLIVSFSNNGCSVIDVDDIRVMLWEMLFGEWEFLDGTPCGVEE